MLFDVMRESEFERFMRQERLIDKARRVLVSCKTVEQLACAVRYCRLVVYRLPYNERTVVLGLVRLTVTRFRRLQTVKGQRECNRPH